MITEATFICHECGRQVEIDPEKPGLHGAFVGERGIYPGRTNASHGTACFCDDHRDAATERVAKEMLREMKAGRTDQGEYINPKGEIANNYRYFISRYAPAVQMSE